MRENDDRSFAKSPILVGKVTGDEVVFRSLGTGKSTSRNLRKSSWKSSDVFGNLRTSLDIIGSLRKTLTLSG